MLDRRLRAAPFRRSAVGCDHNGHRQASIGACAFEKNRQTSFRATAARNAPRVVAAGSDSELMTNRATNVLSTSILFRANNVASVLQGQSRCSPLIAPHAKHRAGERLTGTASRPA